MIPPTPPPLVSILVISWNTCSLLDECIHSVYSTAEGIPVEIIVIDNGSVDGSLDMVATKYPDVVLVQNHENVGFARANNQAAELAHGEYLLLLNSDAQLLPQTLANFVNHAQSHPNMGAAGAQLRYPDGRFQYSHADFPTLWRELLILSTLGRRIFGEWYPSHGPEEETGPKIVDYIHGACMFIPRNIYQAAGGLPEQYFMYAEEVDFCLTLHRMNLQVWYHPLARVLHHGGASSQNRAVDREGDMYQSRVRFMRKYRGNIAAELLKMEIILLTAPKLIYHGAVRKLSRGRYGRPVIPFNRLLARLREV